VGWCEDGARARPMLLGLGWGRRDAGGVGRPPAGAAVGGGIRPVGAGAGGRGKGAGEPVGAVAGGGGTGERRRGPRPGAGGRGLRADGSRVTLPRRSVRHRAPACRRTHLEGGWAALAPSLGAALPGGRWVGGGWAVGGRGRGEGQRLLQPRAAPGGGLPPRAPAGRRRARAGGRGAGG
jgi:hypothetical protein